MSPTDELAALVAARLQARAADYRDRFAEPSAATLKRWQRQEEERLILEKYQLRLPLDLVPDEPDQLDLFS